MSENAFLMTAVDVVWCLSCLIGLVEQTAIFRVAQEQLSQSAASSTNGNVKRCVPFLERRKTLRTNAMPETHSYLLYTVHDNVLLALTLSTADTFAPLSKSSSTISMFLILVALIKGVSESWNTLAH